MVCIHTRESAIGLMYRLLGEEERGFFFKRRGKPIPPNEVYELFDRISEDDGKCDELDFLFNQEFPRGADEDEYLEYFVENRKRIQRELFPRDFED